MCDFKTASLVYIHARTVSKASSLYPTRPCLTDQPPPQKFRHSGATLLLLLLLLLTRCQHPGLLLFFSSSSVAPFLPFLLPLNCCRPPGVLLLAGWGFGRIGGWSLGAQEGGVAPGGPRVGRPVRPDQSKVSYPVDKVVGRASV